MNGAPGATRGDRPRGNPPFGDRLESLCLYGVALAAALWVFAPTLGIPYSFDDFDLLEVVARWRTDAYRLVDLLFLPHNEHLIPLWRLAFSGSTWVFGAEARFVHIALVALHAVGAWAAGRLAGAAGAARAGRFAAAISYASVAGFAGAAVWYPTGAVVMGAWVAVLVGLSRFFRMPSPRSLPAGSPSEGTAPGNPESAALWGIAGLAATTGALPALAAPWLALVLCSFGSDPPDPPIRKRARWSALALALAALAILTAVRAIYSSYAGRAFPAPSLHGLAGFFAILGSAPGHFLVTGAGAFTPPDSIRLAASGLGWLLAGLAFWRAARAGRTGRDLLLSLWGGAAALAFAVGINRPEVTFSSLPTFNRYYYPFAAPLCVSLGLLVDRVPRKIALRGWFAGLLLVALLIGQRRSLAPSLPVEVHDLSARFWRQAERLAQMIETEAARPGAPPWVIPEGRVPFYGIPGNGLALRMIVRTTFPRPIAGERFSPTAPTGDRLRLNRVFDRWTDALEVTTATVCALPNGLGPPADAASVADFRVDGRDDAALSGLHPWEPPFRWMGAAARLRLTSAPGDLIVRALVPAATDFPNLPAAAQGFVLDARVQGVPLGTFRFDPAGGEQVAHFPTAGRFRGADRPVEVELSAHPTWRPSETRSGSPDTRELSIALLAVGFSNDPLDRPRPMRCLPPG